MREQFDAPIGRNPKDRKKCVLSKRTAKCGYSLFCNNKGIKVNTHINASLETGRTHQIRVHMAYIGHPVSGDKVYGVKNEKVDFEGQCLHARKIGFIHPKPMNILNLLPNCLIISKNILKSLRIYHHINRSLMGYIPIF